MDWFPNRFNRGRDKEKAIGARFRLTVKLLRGWSFNKKPFAKHVFYKEEWSVDGLIDILSSIWVPELLSCYSQLNSFLKVIP